MFSDNDNDDDEPELDKEIQHLVIGNGENRLGPDNKQL